MIHLTGAESESLSDTDNKDLSVSKATPFARRVRRVGRRSSNDKITRGARVPAGETELDLEYKYY